MSAVDQQSASSGQLLAAGLRALERGDRDQAAEFLAALYRDGADLHYRELAGAFVEVQR